MTLVTTPTEASLRQLLQQKPKHARAMFQLACLLSSNHDDNNNNSKKKNQQQQEALEWAQKAMEIAPNKPYGYAAMSMVHDNFHVRMQHIQLALDRMENNDNNDNDEHSMAKIHLYIRLLIEPREDEKRHVQGVIGKASLNHPSKRSLNAKEESIYQIIEQQLLQKYSNNDSPNEFLALREYKLGLFFRKLQPSKIYTPRAKLWLTRSIQHFPSENVHIGLAQFWLATMNHHDNNDDNNKNKIAKCPQEYIVGLYSTFAERFDDLLVEKLNYQTPTVLRKLVDDCIRQRQQTQQEYEKNQNSTLNATIPSSIHVAADLGCGTGLSGAAFQNCTVFPFREEAKTKLIGVDLSPEMVERARKRNCYHELFVGDVTAILAQKRKENSDDDPYINYYSLVFACDVFVYIGDLEEIVQRVYQSLIPRGIFAFSTELLVPAGQINNENHKMESPDYVLHACARFAHKQEYVERLAIESGFSILQSKICPIRKNEGKDVTGFLIVLQKEG